MKTLPDNSVDSLVTDPPAGISFMGKDWDDDKGGRDEWIAWMASVMKEAMRVMKPGAHGLVWAIPRTSHWTGKALEDAGFEVRDCITHLFGSGFPKSLNVGKAVPSFEGWGTALKPAAEFWWLVRKPIGEKTVAKNVLKWGTGALNIDAGRIGSETIKTCAKKGMYGTGACNNGKPYITDNRDIPDSFHQGRFPANLLLSHSPNCTEDACDMFDCAVVALDEQSLAGGMHSAGAKREKVVESRYQASSYDMSSARQMNRIGDSGGASRFFYCAKISSGERNSGGPNGHPTVKAKKLMSYLIRLITPPGGVVLDPFMGSGSTGLAAKEEGFQFIGIEKEEEYFQIAKARIK